MPVGFNRGPWFRKLLGESAKDLHFATPSYTAGTHGVQTGYVLLEPKTQSYFDRMKGSLEEVVIENQSIEFENNAFKMSNIDLFGSNPVTFIKQKNKNQ